VAEFMQKSFVFVDVYDIVVKLFTFTISSPDEFIVSIVII